MKRPCTVCVGDFGFFLTTKKQLVKSYLVAFDKVPDHLLQKISIRIYTCSLVKHTYSQPGIQQYVENVMKCHIPLSSRRCICREKYTFLNFSIMKSLRTCILFIVQVPKVFQLTVSQTVHLKDHTHNVIPSTTHCALYFQSMPNLQIDSKPARNLMVIRICMTQARFW